MACAALAVCAFVLAPLHAQQPTFRSGVELVRLDVTVVDGSGTPVADLTPDDFEVRIDGAPAPVRSLRLLDLGSALTTASASLGPAYTSNLESPAGRLIVLAVDEENLPEDSARPLLQSVAAMIDRLAAGDRMSIAGLPDPGPRVDFTNDRSLLKDTLYSLQQRRPLTAASPALGTFGGDGIRTSPTAGRGLDVSGRGMGMDHPSRQSPSLQGLQRGLSFLESLSKLVESLVAVEGPKTLWLVSSGLPFDPDLLHRYKSFARAAAEARVTLHVLRTHAGSGSASGNAGSQVAEAPGDLDGAGVLAGLTGGTLTQAVGSARGVLERLERETTASYVLGVDAPGGRALSKPLDVTVRVTRPGVSVRSPKQVVPPVRTAYRNVKDALRAALQQPRPATEFPLRVMTATRRGASGEALETLVSVETGLDAQAARGLRWAWQVVSGSRIVARGDHDRLPPGTRSDVDTAFVTAVALKPGRYALQLAAVDRSGRRASVTHGLEVFLPDFGSGRASDLLVGTDDGVRLLPLSAVSPATGLTAAIELYPSDPAAPLEVEFALRGADGANRAVRRATPALLGPGRTRASVAFDLAPLTSGRYVVVATVLSGRAPLAQSKRTVDVETAHPRPEPSTH
jgi:VWFA-related protein